MLTITAVLFALIGLALGAGGLQLAWLGGSLYYVVAGVWFLVTAALLFSGGRPPCGSMPC